MDTFFGRPAGRFFMRGVTLVELLMVIVVLGVLTSMASAAYQHWLFSQSAQAGQHQLKTLLSFARGYALNQHQTVMTCARNAQGLCAGTGKSWQQGALVFIDHSGSGTYDPAQDLLLRDQPLLSDVTVTFNRGAFASFNELGMGTQAAGRFCFGQPVAYSLVISFTGRMRTEYHPGCAQGQGCPSC